MVKLRFSYREAVSTLHVALENGSDLHVNESQDKDTIAVGPLENKKAKWRFFTSHGAHLNCTIMAMLYTHSIGNQP